MVFADTVGLTISHPASPLDGALEPAAIIAGRIRRKDQGDRMATCPECDAELEIDDDDLDEMEAGDPWDCEACGSRLRVLSTDPLDFETDEEEDEEDEEEKKDPDAEEAEVEDDADDDEDTGGGDWDE
jgi:lysine biosynthesis protein LysW